MLAAVRGGRAAPAALRTARAGARLPRRPPTRSAARRAQARQKARAQGLANVTFEAGDADTLPLPAGGFDVALCSSGMLYFADVGAALRRIAGWLRPGGRLAFNTPVVRASRSV
jgi:SAM-dependent methyltransferase